MRDFSALSNRRPSFGRLFSFTFLAAVLATSPVARAEFSESEMLGGATLPPGLKALYESPPPRNAACDRIGQTIAAGTYEVMNFGQWGFDKTFRSLVNTTLDSEAIVDEVRNITPEAAGRPRAGSLPWMLVNSPNPAAKRAAVAIQMQSAWNHLAAWKNHDPSLRVPTLRYERLIELLDRSFEELANAGPPKVSSGPLVTAKPSHDYRDDLGIENRAAATLLCLDVFPTYTNTCGTPLVSRLARSAPKHYSGEGGQFYWLLDPELREVFQDPAFAKPLYRIAQTILRAIRGAEATGRVGSDIQREVYRMFSRELPGQDLLATDRAWKVLAAYATQGASFGILETFLPPETAPRLAALQIISVGMSYLDAFAERDGGKYFSLPPFVHGTCRITKPYHFWLAAYLARDAVRFGKREPKSAAAMAHMLGFLYELSSRSNGRDDAGRIFRKGELYSVHNDSIRLSIVTKDLGALFGAHYSRYARSGPVVDVSEKFGLIQKKSKKPRCDEKSTDMDRLIHRTPFFGHFSRLGQQSKIVGCFEDALGAHAIRDWKEFEF